jgi:phosphoglycolate phosphatase-like HAD superfamily hydrolase
MDWLVLFDIDGTLLLTGGAGGRGMVRAGRELFGDAFRWEAVDPSGGLDPLLVAEALAHGGLSAGAGELAAFRELYVRYLEDELRGRPQGLGCMPGIHDLVSTLRGHGGLVLGLLTGNYEPSARLKLQAAGLEPGWFAVGAFGDEAPSRRDLVTVAHRKYLDRFGHTPRPERTVIVGDTPRDVDCALHNGCLSVAVATGRHRLTELRAAGAHVAVEDLSDPRPFLRLLGLDGAPRSKRSG